MLNWFKYFDQKNQTIFYPKMFQYPQAKICPREQNDLIPPVVFSCENQFKNILMD